MAGRLPSLVKLLRLRLHRSSLGQEMEKRVGLEDLHRSTDQNCLHESFRDAYSHKMRLLVWTLPKRDKEGGS